MVLRGGAAAALVLVCLLSGCSSKAGGDGHSDLQLADGKTVDLSAAAAGQQKADRGVISGVVVDAAIRPIPGANLTLLGQGLAQGRATRTDGHGVFVLPDLLPGLYTVAARATGFLPVQTTAEVKAGETSKVRMVMDLDASPQPYHITWKFKAHEDLGNGLVDEAWDLFLANGTGPVPGTGPEPFCHCRFWFGADQQVTAFVFESVWTDSVPKPGGGQCVPFLGCVTGPTQYYWELYDADSHYQKWASGTCASPCRALVNGTTFDAKARNFWTALYTDSNWVGLQQDYELFVTPFYNGAPPEGWSFVKGDA